MKERSDELEARREGRREATPTAPGTRKHRDKLLPHDEQAAGFMWSMCKIMRNSEGGREKTSGTASPTTRRVGLVHLRLLSVHDV